MLMNVGNVCTTRNMNVPRSKGARFAERSSVGVYIIGVGAAARKQLPIMLDSENGLSLDPWVLCEWDICPHVKTVMDDFGQWGYHDVRIKSTCSTQLL
ncbi:hypothetical protein HBI81_151900 [Parastagonospora nodorum]|nr:hypothetical protein HBH53_208620 [Parastagonospora nodorum]KAH3990920.1 hypothetical protein HBI10_240860 [Parastagonospora nodorum]KAH4032223.1 hypothetical protein HBI13_021720 [Parastagonospora nodorum]KAH4049889.1 hypothetical protein HBH49_138820 [Parastagonospora nodorum]KAH4180761.1 hypothetical protein HBH43_008500 [Parastagonospora nodorum]